MTDDPAEPRARRRDRRGSRRAAPRRTTWPALGWTDVLLLEQGHLSGGTTWHAAGLVGPLRATEGGTRLVQYSAELYDAPRGRDRAGHRLPQRRRGGRRAHRGPDGPAAPDGGQRRGVRPGVPAASRPTRPKELWPPMQVDDLLGAIWLPGDGKVNPTDLTQSLAKGARQRGARIVEGVRVTGLLTEDGPTGPRVTGVRTDRGDVEAEVVVNCAGQWAKAVAELRRRAGDGAAAQRRALLRRDRAGAGSACRPADHARPRRLDLLQGGGRRARRRRLRARRQAVGGARRDPAPLRVPAARRGLGALLRAHGRGARAHPGAGGDRHPQVLQRPRELHARQPVPARRAARPARPLRRRGLQLGRHRVGRRRRARPRGVDRRPASPTSDLVGVDVRRFAPYAADNAWLRSRVAETLGLHYAIPWPLREPAPAAASAPRRSTTGSRHRARRSAAGWAGSGRSTSRRRRRTPRTSESRHTWGRPAWQDWSSAEQRATREAVAVFDQTSFSKYVVRGPGALEALQWVCANDVDVPPGGCVYTPLLNARGTYEADLTVTRVADDEFLLVSSSATTVRDLDWIGRHLHPRVGSSATVEDRTDDCSVIGVMGPALARPARRPRRRDLAEDDFPFATSQEVTLAGARVRATRMTYVGELGWELMVPRDSTPAVYDALVAAGSRSRAGRRRLPRDRVPPAGEGLPRVRARADPRLHARSRPGWSSPPPSTREKDFLGRDALAAHRTSLAAGGPRRRLVSFVVDDPRTRCCGEASWYCGDGEPAGQVTSAAWGETVGACVGLAYLRHDGPVRQDWLDQGGLEVDVAGRAARGQRHAAGAGVTVHAHLGGLCASPGPAGSADLGFAHADQSRERHAPHCRVRACPGGVLAQRLEREPGLRAAGPAGLCLGLLHRVLERLRADAAHRLLPVAAGGHAAAPFRAPGADLRVRRGRGHGGPAARRVRHRGAGDGSRVALRRDRADPLPGEPTALRSADAAQRGAAGQPPQPAPVAGLRAAAARGMAGPVGDAGGQRRGLRRRLPGGRPARRPAPRDGAGRRVRQGPGRRPAGPPVRRRPRRPDRCPAAAAS